MKSTLALGNMDLEIGKKIKSIRKEYRVTLETLSQRTGLSKGYLSKIEKSEKAPPVFTLARIARALNVTISSLLGEDSKRISFCLNRRQDRKRRNIEELGYFYETLVSKYPNKMMDPFIIIFPNNPKKSRIPQHEGEEFLYLLEGKLKFIFEDHECILEKGDCIYFDSGKTYHECQSLGSVDAQCLVLFCTAGNKE